jgi:hypothetical protein
MIDMWIATYERRSHDESPLLRCLIAKIPPATNPPSATIAIGTCT